MNVQENLRAYIVNDGLKGNIPKGFNDDYDLIDSGVIDSLFMMSLVAHLEQQYQVEFGINDMVPQHFQSIRALTEFVKSKAN